MKISVQEIEKKLKNGWKLVGPDTASFTLKPPYDSCKVVRVDNKTIKIDVDRPIRGQQPTLKFRPMALVYPKDSNTFIAIDEIKEQPKVRVKKKKVDIIVKNYYAHEHSIMLALYVYYKAIKTYGRENVNLIDRDDVYKSKGADISPRNHLIIVGTHKGFFQELKNEPDLEINTRDKYILKIDSTARSIIRSLRKIGIDPCVTEDVEIKKIISLLEGVQSRQDDNIMSYIGYYVCRLTVKGIMEEIDNGDLMEYLDKWMNGNEKESIWECSITKKYLGSSIIHKNARKQCKLFNIPFWRYKTAMKHLVDKKKYVLVNLSTTLKNCFDSTQLTLLGRTACHIFNGKPVVIMIDDERVHIDLNPKFDPTISYEERRKIMYKTVNPVEILNLAVGALKDKDLSKIDFNLNIVC